MPTVLFFNKLVARSTGYAHEQQEMLLDIIQNRRLETRRKEIAEMARESLIAFHAGELKPQPVEDIIEKLRLELQG